MAREPRTQQKPAGFVSWLGLCALGRKGSQGEYGIGGERRGKREERKGEIRRDGVEGESSEEGKKGN